LLETIDLSQKLTREEYNERLRPLQVRFAELAYSLYEARRSLLVCYEGWDAAGKGGNIRRVTELIDPRGYEVFAIAAPTGDEREHHWLWRFWGRLRPPDDKQVTIFDRSWYGRVLVERVEGFATEIAWRRAYREINEFERQLVDSGATVVKFWLHISNEEQLRRFQDREATAYKSWKLTDEDHRNRSKWPLYEAAVEEMLARTSTLTAPWHVIAAEDKRFARVATLDILTSSVADALAT